MAKSGFVVGGIIGATAIILLFAFIIIPSQEIGTPELITSNGHGVTILGDEMSSAKSKTALSWRGRTYNMKGKIQKSINV